eukprot:CAMPEP_0201524562 /NCGR_PEP_ID=MMETSP0161_2-20130828/23398_1 /ASSEMBLY_ACC=CAM_ASM_000251 /TAXON_ID=180227 /ORGANISM="Neoparamoeba aestuarina, Strain SoJaBio B1-5/56/2" /LENGTH=119 /DNA_ID=CAMNT_0047924027 /DNA_START=149 /DNA_END=509 /DNA_ORIENTATION=-
MSDEDIESGSSTLKVTDKAIERMNQVFTAGDVLRLEVLSGGCGGYQYKFSVDKLEDVEDEDIMIKGEGNTGIAVDEVTLSLLSGSTIDYVEEMSSCSFRVMGNPQAEDSCSCGASFSAK